MSENSHESKQWLWLLIIGLVLVAIGTFAIHSHGWLKGILLGLGGLVVVFASFEMMIHAVDGFAKRKKMNSFVAGTMAGFQVIFLNWSCWPLCCWHRPPLDLLSQY